MAGAKTAMLGENEMKQSVGSLGFAEAVGLAATSKGRARCVRKRSRSRSGGWMLIEEGRRRRRLEARGARQSPCRSDVTRRVLWALWGMWVVFWVD